MKRLLLLLLIPTLSYSQITFDDIMSINSEKTFKRVVIENGFEFSGEEEEYISYGLDITKDSIDGDRSSLWSRYNKINGEFQFQFSYGGNLFGLEFNDDDNPYDILVEKIKKNCNYYDVLNEGGVDYVCYSCPQSSYKGKIGFTKSNGSGMIKHIIPKTPITYNDLMSINSPITFNNIISEKGYDIVLDTDTVLVSVLNHVGNNKSLDVFVYNKVDWEDGYKGEFKIQYNLTEVNNNQNHNILINKIKTNCTFYDTLKNDGWIYDYISYTCSESKFKGKIGYSITDSTSFIKHIIPK